MLFCPYCSNNLTIGEQEDGSGEKAWLCPTCPYKWNIENPIAKRTHLPIKEPDDVLGGEDAWKNVDKTPITCPKCDHREAFWRQMQIRSADEPSTNFYKCVSCEYFWREN